MFDRTVRVTLAIQKSKRFALEVIVGLDSRINVRESFFFFGGLSYLTCMVLHSARHRFLMKH